MNLLHRYLFRDVLFASVLAVAIFAFVLLSGVALHDLVSRTASGQLTVAQAGWMLVLVLPSLLTYSLPFGILTGVLLVLGRLSAQNEITAMRCAGLGLVRIGAPILLIALAAVAFGTVINFYYAPRLKTEYRRLLFEVGQTNPAALVVPGTFVRDFPGAVVYVGSRDGSILQDIWVWTIDRQHRVTSCTWVERGEIHVNRATETISLMALGQVRGERRDEDRPEDFTKPPQPVFFDASRPVWEEELGEVFKQKVFRRKPSWLDLGELIAERRRLQASTDPADQQRLQEVRMNFHEKAARAFAALSVALVAIPLGIQTRRKETSANLGVAMGLLLLLEAGFAAIGWLGDRPDLKPHLLLWTPNIAFQLLAAWLWWRFGKN